MIDNYKDEVFLDENDYRRSGRLHCDWFIKDLGVVIEVQGAQHYRPVAFDGDKEKAIDRFKRQRAIDGLKRRICESINLTLVEINAEEAMKMALDERDDYIEMLIFSEMGVVSEPHGQGETT